MDSLTEEDIPVSAEEKEETSFTASRVEKMESLARQAEEYLETTVEIFRLKILAQASGFLSSITAIIFAASFFVLAFVLFSVGLAMAIGQWLHQPVWGYVIVGMLYCVVGVLLLFPGKRFMRKKFAAFLANFIDKA